MFNRISAIQPESLIIHKFFPLQSYMKIASIKKDKKAGNRVSDAIIENLRLALSSWNLDEAYKVSNFAEDMQTVKVQVRAPGMERGLAFPVHVSSALYRYKQALLTMMNQTYYEYEAERSSILVIESNIDQLRFTTSFLPQGKFMYYTSSHTLPATITRKPHDKITNLLDVNPTLHVIEQTRRLIQTKICKHQKNQQVPKEHISKTANLSLLKWNYEPVTGNQKDEGLTLKDCLNGSIWNNNDEKQA